MRTIGQLQRAAAMRGYSRFDPGRPCPQGHIAERYTYNARCVECQRERERRHRKRKAEQKRAESA